MANILLRSPYFVTVTTAGHLSAQMALTIDGTLRYTILKNATSNRTVFEIASLAKDYYSATYGGGTGSTIDTVAISYVITTYTAVDGGGTATAQSAVTHTGYYGYSEFWDGVNQDFDPDDYELTNTGRSLIIYLPENTAGFAWDMNSGTATKATISTTATSVAATSGNYTWTIERICSAKYTPIKMRFINKNGIPQDQYFFLKSVETINTKSETFKRNIFSYSSSNYDTKSHQTQTFNKTGRKRFTLNTDYIAEAYNRVMEDILLSEYVWIFVSNVIHPVTVVTGSLTKKTSLNDKLIQYTLEVEDANDIINNIV
jgi:predicted secreted protein